MTVIAFHIETTPDIEGGRRLYHLQGLSDKEVANVMFHKRRQETGETESLRHHLHRIVAITCVVRDRDGLELTSLGGSSIGEAELISRFFEMVEHHREPQLITWNGSGFELPVLHYRALVHAIEAPHYWSQGGEVGRRHGDLMEMIAGCQGTASAPLDEVARLLGFPGYTAMGSTKVWEDYRGGEMEAICQQCDSAALNAYLIYLRFQLIRGQIDRQQYEQECESLRDTLKRTSKPHLDEFLAAWQE